MNSFQSVQMLAAAYTASRCLHVVAELGVADVLEAGVSNPVDALATKLGADAGCLQRLLRLLAAHGIFVLDGERVAHNEASLLLRDDHPQSLRAFVRMLGFDVNWRVFEVLEASVRQGHPATAGIVPDGYWQHLAANPRQAAIFNAAMTGKTHAHVAGILRAFDFTPFRRIGDIGGGRGHLLHSVLDIAPAARGLLFDQPHVIEENHALASERIELVGGDFFMDALPDCDLYLLMEIVHDWPDPQAVAILRNVRRAAPADARLLVIEELRSEGSELDWAKTLDVLMLGLLGGRQRTVDEHRALLDEAGWRVERVIGTTGGTSIIEVVAAVPRQR